MVNPNVKLNRTYLFTAELRDGNIIHIRPPFTIMFDVTRKNWGFSNNGSFKIYNLNEKNRNSLRFDQYDMCAGVIRNLTFEAGYVGGYFPGQDQALPGQLATVFKGKINRAYSIRQGVDFITHIEALDLGFAAANAQSNLSVPSNTPFESVLQSLMGDLKPFGVNPGVIGDVYKGQNSSRGNSYSGPTVDLLCELSGNGFFVDNEKSHILGDSECLSGALPVINSGSGLLGTPSLEETYLQFDMIFEPRLTNGQIISLVSGTASDNITNRKYKISELYHRGTISGAFSGDAVTTISCFFGPEGLNLVGP